MNRSIGRLFLTYLIIIATIYICERVSFWLYPLAILILCNQYLTLNLLGHEGIHGLLHRNRIVNRTLARYLCHFPFLISYTHYSMNHLRHHRNLGTDQDPDINIYQIARSSVSSWISQSIVNSLNFSIPKHFFDYYNGSAAFLSGRYPFKIKTDYIQFFFFWLLVLVVVFKFNLQFDFILYWFVPLFLLLPWSQLMNSYQHYSENQRIEGRAYTILFKNIFIKEFLFPINVNYHETHHQRPDVPYFELPKIYKKSTNSYSFLEFSKKIFNSQKSKTV